MHAYMGLKNTILGQLKMGEYLSKCGALVTTTMMMALARKLVGAASTRWQGRLVGGAPFHHCHHRCHHWFKEDPSNIIKKLVSIIISSVRSSYSHPDLLLIHHPPPHFFRSNRSSTLDFHFLSHYSYIKAIMLYKGNHWTRCAGFMDASWV